MLLILPFLRMLVSVMCMREYLFLIGAKAAMALISLIYIYTGYNTNITFPFHVDIIFYPLLGYFLLNMLEQHKYRYLKAKYLVSFLLDLLLLTVLQANAFYKKSGTYVQDFHSVYVWIFAALLLLLIKEIKIKSDRSQKIICAMGSCTFGVYLIEDVARNQVERIVPAIAPFFGKFWTGIVFTLLSVLLSMLVVFILKKLPVIRKLI